MTEKRKSTYFYGYVVIAAGFWVWFISFGIHGTFSVFFLPISSEMSWTRSDTGPGIFS